MDTGCTQTLVRRFMCRFWRPREVNVLTADEKTLKYCKQRQVKLGIDGVEPVNIEALVMDRQLLLFDLILGINAIRAVGGATITPAGVVSFARRKMCVAIRLNEPNFCAEFDQIQNCWTSKWKCSGQMPELSPLSTSMCQKQPALCNEILEYRISKHVRESHEIKLQSWIQNGWLLP